MNPTRTYMDGQPVILWDLVVLANALHVVDEINSGDEAWVKEMGFTNGFIALAGVASAFALDTPENDEDLDLLARLSESEAMHILSRRPDCGGAFRIDAAKAKELIQKKSLIIEDDWLDPKYYVGGGGIA